MNRDNTPTFSTKKSRIAHFNDFSQNIRKEKSDLGKVRRSFLRNEDETYNLPNLKKPKYSRVTRKWDNDSKEEITDRENSIDIEAPAHKYRIDGNNSQSSNLEESESPYEGLPYSMSDMKEAFYAGQKGDKEFDDWLEGYMYYVYNISAH